MQKYLAKIVILSFVSLLVVAGRMIFATNEGTQTSLGIHNNIGAYITYNPVHITGTFTAGHVTGTITGIDITGTLVYVITGNGIYSFPYLRGTGPYTTGAPYGPTNLWNQFFITDTITWIDGLFPTFNIVFTQNGYGVMIFYTDNNPGVQATLNGQPYISGTPITTSGTYTIQMRDIAGNTIIFTITVFSPPVIPGGGGGGGGGGGIGVVIETPPCGDDQIMCAHGAYVPKPGQICALTGHSASCESGTGEVETGNVQGPFSLELTNAYLRAHAYGITTMPNIYQANMTGTLIRKHLAKMISEFTLQFVGIKPDKTKKCIFPDMVNETKEMQYYAVLACQLGLMGLEEDGVTPKKMFDPNMYVNRAQFGTVLSRLLFGDMYNIKEGERNFFIIIKNGIRTLVAQISNAVLGTNNTPQLQLMWYSKHLQALKEYGIMKKIDEPMMLELRGYVMLMLMRAEINGTVDQRSQGLLSGNVQTGVTQ